ncbi:hypothetical protein ABZ348_13380 [Streptomyces sp. NPDC005963]|uniref:hypothetical protein n=1 Tax=Streptomyces sp. NPDC005963 TaxID=3156721 RepID=UPI0033F1A168
MSDKTVQTLGIEIDDLSLSLVGWQIDEVEARLVTKSYGKKDHYQEIAVSGTVRFLPEDWTDRFSGSDYAPPLLMALSRREDSPAAPRYERVVLESVKKVSKRPQRISLKSTSWECKKPLAPEDIALRLTAFDLEEIDSGLNLPPTNVTALPIDVLDETTHESVRLRLNTSSAHILRDAYDKVLRVHLEGSAEFGTARELLADHLAAEDWRDEDATLEDECPFEVALPGLVVEVLDEAGFLLQKSEVSFYGHIAVTDGAKLPGRQPRWIADVGDDLDEYAGQPARVVVRLVDAEDL